MGRTMQNGVSGWYARLDRCLDNRQTQIEMWLDAWENSLRTHQPIAALLPEDWPTLPANLLTDPGHVLDHLLARHDAESDGRSPRGAHPTPLVSQIRSSHRKCLRRPFNQKPRSRQQTCILQTFLLASKSTSKSSISHQVKKR